MAKKLRVDHLPRSFTSAELEGLLTPFGTVNSAEVIFDQETETSLGFGLVEMDDAEAGEEAILALDGSDLQGSKIAVRAAPD